MNKKIYSFLLSSLFLTQCTVSKAAFHTVDLQSEKPIETHSTINITADISLLAFPIGLAGLWLTVKGFTKAHKRRKIHTFLQILTGSTLTATSFIFLTNPKKYSEWISDYIETRFIDDQD